MAWAMAGIEKLERVLDYGGAAWLGLCTANALFALGLGTGPASAAAIALAGGGVAGLATFRVLARLGSTEQPLPDFTLVSNEWVEPQSNDQTEGELLLTEIVLSAPNPAPSDCELLLDDVLAELHSDSRVVQLFDPLRTPTAGELKARIDKHLREGRAVPAEEERADASQALYDALADLRRSLG